VTEAEVRAELDRVLASRILSASDRQRRLLRYLVHNALAGTAAPKEYTIGVEVFDRGDDYDPRVDSTVRVSAAKLRDKLREYYLSDGKGAPLRIVLPKGTYLPVFEPAAAPCPEAETHSSLGQHEDLLRPNRRLWITSLAAGTFIAIAAFLAGKQSSRPVFPAVRALTFRQGTVSGARFIPGSEDILYSASWQGAPHQLFSVRAGVPESHSIGLTDAQILSVSPAGDVAILSKPIALNLFAYVGTIARSTVAGSPPRGMLPAAFEADWHPSTNQLLVTVPDGLGTRLEFPKGHLLYRRAVGSLRFPRFSPRGDLIAFADRPSAVRGDTRGSLCVVDLNGRVRQLTGEWSNISGLAWAKRGKEIWFSAAEHGFRNDLYAADLNGRVRVLWRNVGMLDLLDVSQNDNVLIANNDARTVVVASRIASQGEKDLSWLDGGFTRGISKDGEKLLIEESGEGAGENGAIFVRNVKGDAPLRLGTGFPVALSPDEAWVLAYRRDTSPPRPFVIPTGAGDAAWFHTEGIQFLEGGTWFADSRRVLLIGHKSGAPDRSYAFDIFENRLQALTAEDEWGHLLSPDNSEILLDHPRGVLLDVRTGNRVVTRGLSADMHLLGWTDQPDSVWVQEGDLPARISRLNLSTGVTTPWKQVGPTDLSGAVTIAWLVITPDGQAYAYSYFKVLSRLYLLTGLS
jgi:hypothetical protein